MMKNIKITASSILSVLILLGLMFFFSIGFGIILIIFFITKLYGMFFKKKKESNTESKGDIQGDVIDVDEDDYKID
tara:strand:+ start:222 stop:449 length:228 start_codon:yes stop_codon:yes gene_type:complete